VGVANADVIAAKWRSAYSSKNSMSRMPPNFDTPFMVSERKYRETFSEYGTIAT
jgi:hypothetical protein